MYSKALRNLLSANVDRATSTQLPQQLETYLRSGERMSNELLCLVSYYLRVLEKKLYKSSSNLNSLGAFERHLERVTLFLEFVNENRDKDGALLLTTYRWLFANAELYLKLKHRRIAVGTEDMTVTKRLQCPELKHIRVMSSIKQDLEDKRQNASKASQLASWKAYTTKKNKGKVPGKVATDNFVKRLETYQEVQNQVLLHERGWLSKSA